MSQTNSSTSSGSSNSNKKPPPISIESNLGQFTIHKLRISPKKINGLADKHKKGKLHALAIWIHQLVMEYRSSSDNSNQRMTFQEVNFSDSSWWPSHKYFQFHVRFYYSVVIQQESPLGTFLTTMGGTGDFQGSRSIHYLFFFYRELVKTSEAGKDALSTDKKRVYEVFALTTGQAWQVLKKRDFRFPVQLFKRVASSGDIKKLNARELTGPTLCSSSLYRESPSTSSSEHLYHIVTRIKALLRPSAYLRACSPFKTKKGPTKAKIGLELGFGSIQFKKTNSLPGYAFLLNYFSEVCSGKFHCRLDDKRKGLSKTKEEDDPDLDYLDFVHPVDLKHTKALDAAKQDLIWEVFQGNSQINLYFCHKYAKDFFSSKLTLFFQGKPLGDPWDYPPSLDEVFKFLKEQSQFLKVQDKKNLFDLLDQLSISFLVGGRKRSFSFIECIEGEVTTGKGVTYFYIMGAWQQATVEYHVSLQRDFNLLLNDCLVPEGDPAHLPTPWIPKESWASFTLEDLNQHTSQGERVLKAFQGKSKKAKEPYCSQIGQIGGNKCFLMNCNVSLSKLQLKEKEKAATESFLKERFKLKKLVKAEGPYNETYLYDQMNDGDLYGPEEGWIPGDRIDHTARKIEIFDIVRYTQDSCFLFHVKEGFGGTTRVACSQIRNSAKQFQQFRNAIASSTVVQEFWNEVISSNEKGYREKLKKQLLGLGKNKASAYKAFQDIFTRRNFVFVYAFLDSEAREERLLENENNYFKRVKFLEKDFNDPSCLNFRNKANIKPSQILELLEKEKYLLDGCATDKFLVCPEKNFSLPVQLGKTTQIPAIYRKMRQKLAPFLSQFDSTIAKVELYSLRKELENMGFGFKICQIRRPSGAIGRGSFQKKPSLNISTGSAPYEGEGNWVANREFVFEQQRYKRETTRGKGACALHALLGEQVEGEYRYPTDAGDPDAAVKEEFFNRFLNSHDQDVEGLIERNFKELLGEVTLPSQNQGINGKMIFLDDGKAQEAYETWFNQNEELEKQKNVFWGQEGAIWKGLRYTGSGDDLKDALEQINFEEGKEVSAQFLAQRVHESWENFQVLFLQENNQTLTNEITNIRVQIEEIKAGQQAKQLDFLSEPLVWERYQTVFVDNDYYLTTTEVDIAARLFNKRVTLLAYSTDGSVGRSEHNDFNENAQDHVTIFHEGTYRKGIHFERCTLIQ
ncbi:hypothetical protein [Candidatus Neptunochlamydia vexilliferae]|uniref:Uncharacterized protein n=1 Tax=Candidatus Neptunichlamydia vexilliferae TaxID=1651774 RepID=A0ABS0B1N6_9BACT|nr:hypothetical protein [Candidatus Neptunochlamydia vexilliferae]MBF5059455.1 hypothetical protein [Candidatus Neptunochlamydia vexilliferae]